MTPRQRIGSAIYALVAQELANPKHPTILLSHDGFLKSSITCFTPQNQLVALGSGFQPNESVTVTAIAGASNGSDADILTAVANASGAFMVQGTSTSPAIPCSGGGPLSVVARGDKGSVSSEPVLIVTPTPTPTATPIPIPVPGTVTVAENEVEWAAANGDNITAILPDSTGILLIRDDALETTKSGTAVFSVTVAGTKHFDIATGKTGTTSANATTTRVITAVGYASTSPSSTPLTDRADITATEAGGSTPFVTAANNAAGTFSLISAVSATTTATFKYHVQDVWSGTDSAFRRAKVTSTSDPAGEWVTISEVASATDSSSRPTSRLFRGEVPLSSNSATQGTAQNGVWVQAGDTITVSYVNAAGNTLAMDTLGVLP
jgi:hypothetical protein